MCTRHRFSAALALILGLSPLSLAQAPDAAGGGALSLIQVLPWGPPSFVRAAGADRVLLVRGEYVVLADVVAEAGEVRLVERSRLLLGLSVADAAVDQNRAYVALGDGGGLAVLDLSDPAAISILGQRQGFDGTAVALWDRYAYVGAGLDRLLVVDILNPANPIVVNEPEVPGGVRALSTAESNLYVLAAVDTGPDLRVLDISTPNAPWVRSVVSLEGTTSDLAVDWPHAYVAGDSGLAVVRVASPEAPSVEGTLPIDEGPSRGLGVVGDRVFVVTTSLVSEVDVSAPWAPALVTSTPVGEAFDAALDAGGLRLFVADRSQGVRIFDVAAAPLQVGLLGSAGGFAHDVAFHQGHLYTVDSEGGLRIADVRPLMNGTGEALETGRVIVPPGARRVEAGRSHAFVTDTLGPGLTVVNAADPARPSVVATYPVGAPAFGMDWWADRLFVAAGPLGLLALDVTSPAAPSFLGLAPLGNANAVDVVIDSSRGVAFVASGEDGVFAVDVSNPGAMTTLDQESTRAIFAVDLEEEAWWPSGDILYAAAGDSGLRRIDVSSPTALVDLTPPWQDSSRAVDVAAGFGFFGDYGAPVAYVADDTYGATVHEMGIGAFGGHATGEGAWGIDACVECAFVDVVAVAAGYEGVYLFYGTLYLASAPSVPDGPPLHVSMRPNPARDVTEVDILLEVPTTVRIEVFDATGRRLMQVGFESLRAGPNSIRLDSSGWPSGVYLVRVDTGDATAATQLTVVR